MMCRGVRLRSVRARRNQEVGPEQAHHRRERSAGVSVARRVIGRDLLPAAVLEGDARAVLIRLEAHLDLGLLTGLEVARAKSKTSRAPGSQTRTRPSSNGSSSDRSKISSRRPPTPGLEAHHALARMAGAEARAVPPPGVDLVGEHLETRSRDRPSTRVKTVTSSSEIIAAASCACARRASGSSRAARPRSLRGRPASARARGSARAAGGTRARARRPRSAPR